MPQSPRSCRWKLIHADCLTALPKHKTASMDAVITDPPYGISIVGMKWDAPRRLDPSRPPGRKRSRGNPGVAFQMFCAEWASECLRVLKPGAHLAAFGSPQTAHLLACGIEESGFELRDTLMWIYGNGYPKSHQSSGGKGTGLKPAYEPIILARKPLERNLQHTLARYHTGALNIAASRIPLDCQEKARTHSPRYSANQNGRWPANLTFSHHPQCADNKCQRSCPVRALGTRHRFFYCTRANRHERNAGCEHLSRRTRETFKTGSNWQRAAEADPIANFHPTVKPIELMRWLIRLLTPPHGLILDPFAGSGSTGAAAVQENTRFIGIERESAYIVIARARIKNWAQIASRSRGSASDEQAA